MPTRGWFGVAAADTVEDMPRQPGSVADSDPRIIATTLERLRLGLSIEAVGIALALLLSEPLGIPLPRSVLLINAFALTLAIGTFVADRIGALPRQHTHAISMCVWLLAPITTLSSLAVTAQPTLVYMVMIELALASTMQTSLRHLVVSTSCVAAAYVVISLRVVTPDVGIQICSVGGMTAATWLVGRGIRRSMDSAIEREDLQAETAAQLKLELEERRRAEGDRRRAEEEREGIRDQFVHAQRMEAVGTLAAGLAHDMNNIIGGILGLAEVAAEECSETSVRADLDAIAREAVRAGELTRGLLAFSRRGQYRRAAVNLESVIDDVEPLLSRMFGNRITLERRGGADIVIDADAAQLEQAIVNLCINGVDAMDGRGVLTVSTAVAFYDDAQAARYGLAAGAFATITVRDTGRGMTESVRKQIFEPFFTTKPVGEGTGLGLAMVYGTVRGHGGAIEVESEPERGSAFTIHLPQSTSPVIARTISARDSSRIKLPSRLALVVDDEPMIRATATRILRQMGLSVVGASDGAEALEVFAARRDEISIIVLDMSMPVMGGAECLREIRRKSRVPVVIASGYANESETQTLLAQGNAVFLEKPYSVEQMREHVQHLLDAVG